MTEPDTFIPLEDIISRNYLPDALDSRKQFKPSERDMKIYARNAAGETMTSLAGEYNMTKQNVSRLIAQINENGYGYKTEKEKQAEKKRIPTPENRYMESSIDIMLRDYMIYSTKINWKGSLNEFFQTIKETYGLEAHYVQNIVSRQKRIERLRDEFFIHENITYKSLEEVYHDVYSEFQTMRKEDPQITQSACAKHLAEKYGFKEGNVWRIIGIMSSDNKDNYFVGKKKLTPSETYNRDKAIFIDFLKWNGDRNSFCQWATKKYDLRKDYVSTIIKYCLWARIDRIENVEFRLLEE